jgi:hypothetical protein
MTNDKLLSASTGVRCCGLSFGFSFSSWRDPLGFLWLFFFNLLK